VEWLELTQCVKRTFGASGELLQRPEALSGPVDMDVRSRFGGGSIACATSQEPYEPYGPDSRVRGAIRPVIRSPRGAAHTKPLLRGRIHQFAFFAAIPAAILLLAVARRTTARVAVAIYGLSLVALFGTSAAYHRIRWTDPARAPMRRLDHSMI
jgi:hypothetical protein